MVKETVAMVYGLTNRNCQSYITTPPPPPNFILHICVVPEKLLTNSPELIPPVAQKFTVYSKSLTPQFMTTTDPAMIDGHQATII